MTIPVFLSELVRTIIIMTLSGGLLALLLLLIKPLIRHRLPKAAQYFFWLVVLFTFLIPVSRIITLPGTIADIAPFYSVVGRNVVSTAEAQDRLPAMEMPVFTPATNVESPPAVTPDPITQAITIFMLIYPLMFAVVLLYNAIGYAYFVSKLRRKHFRPLSFEQNMLTELTKGKRTPKMIVSHHAATPMLVGVFRPIIVLPNREYTNEQIHSILLHELTHMWRLDVAVKWLTLLACAAHWFNPLVWIFKGEIDRACELSCDEAVINNMDTYGKRNYGETLISVASNKKIPMPVLSTTMCQEKRALKERLTAIMKSKKHTKLAVLISAFILLAVILAACATGAGGNQNPADDTTPVADEYYYETDDSTSDTQGDDYEEYVPEPYEPSQQTDETPAQNNPDYITIQGQQFSTSLTTMSLDAMTGPLTDEDILPLRYMSALTELWVGVMGDYPIHVTNLDSLAGLTNLTDFAIAGDYLTDISGLAGLTNLRWIHIFHSNVSDISPMAGLTNLEVLQFGASPISDISPLAGLTNLWSLSLMFNQISDITPLTGLTNLHTLDLRVNQITDITPIASLINDGRSNLSSLTLSNNQISDISPLAVFPHLDSLWLDGNPITDLSSVDHIPHRIFEMMDPI